VLAGKGDEDHIDYTSRLYWWGVYQMFSSNSQVLLIFHLSISYV
jgi:hypothetical protein